MAAAGRGTAHLCGGGSHFAPIPIDFAGTTRLEGMTRIVNRVPPRKMTRFQPGCSMVVVLMVFSTPPTPGRCCSAGLSVPPSIIEPVKFLMITFVQQARLQRVVCFPPALVADPGGVVGGVPRRPGRSGPSGRSSLAVSSGAADPRRSMRGGFLVEVEAPR